MTSRCGDDLPHRGHYVSEGKGAWWCSGVKPNPNRATRRAAKRLAKRTPEVPPEHVTTRGRYG